MKPDFSPYGVLKNAPYFGLPVLRAIFVAWVTTPINTFLGIHGTLWSILGFYILKISRSHH